VIGALRAPQGWRFTGLLWLETIHLDALEIATAATLGVAQTSLAGLIGYLARLGHWPVLAVYWVVWAWAGLVYLLGLRTFLKTASLPVMIALGLPALVFPTPWLMLAACGIWVLVFLPVDRPDVSGRRHLTSAGAAIVLGGWLLLWTRLGSAPYAYVDEGTWQLLLWVRQNPSPQEILVAPAHLNQLFVALGGRQIHDPALEIRRDQPVLIVTTGADCEAATTVVFRYGERCVTEQATVGLR
jgi:hypothetical protein